jgi:hypothetical protein
MVFALFNVGGCQRYSAGAAMATLLLCHPAPCKEQKQLIDIYIIIHFSGKSCRRCLP